MRRLLFIWPLFVIFACSPFEEDIPNGTVSIKGIHIEGFEQFAPEARTESTWEHVLVDYAEIILTNQATGDEYTLGYDPGDFREAYNIQVPMGEYAFTSIVAGEDLEDYLPYEVNGVFSLTGANVEITLEAHTEYGLVSVANEYINQAELVHNGSRKEMRRSADRLNYYQYAKGGLSVELEIEEYFDNSIINESLTIEEMVHHHYTVRLPESGNLNVVELVLQEFAYTEEGLELDSNVNWIVRDVEGNVYKVVKIGNQYWMAENLRTGTFCNGDELGEIDPPSIEWEFGVETPTYYHINHDPSYDEPFGKLYNAAAVLDERSICPCDWEIPTLEDWEELREYLGGPLEASAKMRNEETMFWRPPYNDGATNESGFNALGTGFFIHDAHGTTFYQADFHHILELATWWTSTLIEQEIIGWSFIPVQAVGIESRGFINTTRHDGGDFTYLHGIRCIKKN